jgi:hypothetical protein
MGLLVVEHLAGDLMIGMCEEYTSEWLGLPFLSSKILIKSFLARE